MSATFLQHLVAILNFICIFATSEGRNPWVKNAFLALSHVTKSPNFSRGMRTMQRSFCFVYTAYSPRCTSQGIYDSVGYLFLSSFLRWRLAMPVTWWARQVSTLFLYTLIKHKLNNADFGRLAGDNDAICRGYFRYMELMWWGRNTTVNIILV